MFTIFASHLRQLLTPQGIQNPLIYLEPSKQVLQINAPFETHPWSQKSASIVTKLFLYYLNSSTST